ncbi:tetratricopeptide repeat protein [Sulfuricella sp.]|uniref:tetratricopeptide repeat protein n=1 Tax=Sulfuricella sp. TaxID=2099377 RepID=UPI002B925B60|nr:tetratricopeptide repeat protein [Sulfuricella sp.]HUX62991.1 tetratricopeptide repeat protein [Sulfuricella sp.]
MKKRCKAYGNIPIRLIRPAIMFNWLKKAMPASEKIPCATATVESCNDSLVQQDLLNGSAAHKKQGNEFLAQGQMEEAAECYRQAVAINPDDAEGFLNLGFVLKEQKHFGDAERYLKRAILINPKMEDAYYLLGAVLQEQGNLSGAIENFSKTIELKADFEMAYGDLFYALLQNGQNERAEDIIKKGIALNSDISEFHYYLGTLYVNERKLDQASDCFLKTLSLQSDHVEAHCNLGLVLQAQGRLDEAVEHYRHALTLQPDYAELHNNLGSAFQAQNRLDEAAENYHHALTLKPEIAEAHLNLISVLKAQGKLDEAVEHYRHALSLKPNDAAVRGNLGHTLHKQGKLDEAIEHYRHALQLKPDYAELHNNLGYAFQEQGKMDEAVESYHQALSFKPGFSEAYRNLIGVLHDQGKLDEEVDRYRQALSLDPVNAVTHEYLGYALRLQGKLDEAVGHYRHALSLKPDVAELHNNLGYVLQAQGKLDAAVEHYRRAIFLKPGIVEAHNNLGNALQEQGKQDEAVQSYRRAIALRPDYVDAYNNLGHTFQAQGKLDEAMECYRHALSLKPDHVQVHGNLLFLHSFHSDCTPAQYQEEARSYGNKLMAQAMPYSRWSVCPVKSGQPLLRVGLVSGDLRSHPVGFFLESILAHLNPARVELVAYPTQLQEDELTARIKSRFASWKPIAGLSDQTAARKIHEDGIHILIDLAGHTAKNRLPVFAWKPAPVQVSWLGYFASTGVPGMDYLLADPVSVPDSHRDHFTETVWYLPDTRLCFTAPATNTNLTLTPLPAARNGYVTFGCFQRLSKINDDVLALWGRIFHALPQSRLRLQSNEMKSPSAREEVQRRLARVGIDPERVMIQGSVPRKDYLAAHADVDIILDTFPYPGGTTTCEALWMGVPTLTLAGDTLLARQGASLLACAGLGDWIASDEDDYVTRALAHAANFNRLARLRSGLREKVLASPLFDALLFALNLEEALQNMWQQKMGPEPDRK